MRKLLWVVLVLSVLIVAPAMADTLRVEGGAIATGIEDRQPVNVVQEVTADGGSVYCFTRIVGAAAQESVFHVWFWGDREMARVELAVGSGNWRTWSSKRILPGWQGDWRVEVQDSQGEVLATIPFSVR